MEPLSEKRYLELHAPAGGDFLAARERLLAALPDGCRLTLGCLQQLYPVLSAADYRVTVTLCPGPGGTDAVRVEPGDTTAEHYGLCLDIGSTIMQMELVDLVRGRTLSQAACTNSQTQFGANILDRILAVKADRENLKTLQALTLSDVNDLIVTILKESDSGEMLASEVKSVLLRLRPNFSEKSVGFSTFGKLIARLSQQFGAFTVESEQFNVIVSLNQPHTPAGEQITRENYARIFARILSEYKEDGFDRVNPSILKSAVQADYPDFTERQIGLRRFSDVLRALEREKLLKLETDEGGNMLVHIL